MKGHIQRLKGHIQCLKGHIQCLKGHIQRLKGHMECLKGHMQRLKGHIQRLKGHMQRLKGHMQRLKGHMQRLKGHIQCVKKGMWRHTAEHFNLHNCFFNVWFNDAFSTFLYHVSDVEMAWLSEYDWVYQNKTWVTRLWFGLPEYD